MQRVQKPKRCRRPKVGDTDDVEEHEPTIGAPDTSPQRADKMSLPSARFAKNHLTYRVVGHSFGVREKIVDDAIDQGFVQLIDLERGIRPDALEIVGPIEVDGAEGPKSRFHLVIHKTYMGSPLKLSTASRIAGVISKGLFSPESVVPSSRCILPST